MKDEIPTKAQAEALRRMAFGSYCVDAYQPQAAACIRRGWATKEETRDTGPFETKRHTRTCVLAHITPAGRAALDRYREQQKGGQPND